MAHDSSRLTISENDITKEEEKQPAKKKVRIQEPLNLDLIEYHEPNPALTPMHKSSVKKLDLKPRFPPA